MKTRKIILLAACAVLLCVCVVQGITGLKNPVKTFTLNDSPDKITISGDGLDVLLTLKVNTWYVGTDNFSVNKADADRIVNAVKEVKVLNSIGRTGNELLEERYGLGESKAIKVSAFKNGKELRTITVGKTSSTGAQSYIVFGGNKEIFLASSNLRSAFDKSADDLRSKNVYSVTKSDITAISVTSGDGTWGIERKIGEDNKIEWTANGIAAGTEIDTSKADSWLQQLSSLNVSSWLPNDTVFPSEKDVEVELTTAGEKVSVTLYKQGSGDDVKYFCTGSKSSHKFELTKSAAEKYLKPAADLKK